MEPVHDTEANIDRAEVVDRLVEHFDHHDPALTKDVLDEVYDRLLDGPRVRWTDAHGGFRLLTRYDDIVEASKNPAVFSSASGVRYPPHPGAPLVIPIEIDPPEHAPFRKLFMDVLSAQRVRAAEPFLRELTGRLVAEYVAGPQEDFVQNVAVQLPIRAIGTLVGWNESANAEIQQHAADILEHYGKPEAIAAMQALGAVAQAEIDDRRANPRDDYMTTLVNTTIDGQALTDEQLQNIVRTFIFAGFETTAHTIASMVAFLAQHPEIQDRIRTDDAALLNVVEEALRLLLPVHTMFRTVKEPTTFHDVDMEPGDVVALLYGPANRDPEKFSEPGEFQVDRPNARQHLAFGFGTHFCVGAQIARAELRILLEVLRDYPNYGLGGEVQYPPHLMGGQMMGVEHLPVKFPSSNEAMPKTEH